MLWLTVINARRRSLHAVLMTIFVSNSHLRTYTEESRRTTEFFAMITFETLNINYMYFKLKSFI